MPSRRASSNSGWVAGRRHLASRTRRRSSAWSVEVPAREERRQRELGEHDQLAAARRAPRAAARAAARRRRRGVSPRAIGPELGGGDGDDAGHVGPPVVRLRPARSSMRVQQHVGAGGEVVGLGVLGRVVADAADARHEDHRRRAHAGQHLRVVARRPTACGGSGGPAGRRWRSTRSTTPASNGDRLEAGQRPASTIVTPSAAASAARSSASRASACLQQRPRRCCAGRR